MALDSTRINLECLSVLRVDQAHIVGQILILVLQLVMIVLLDFLVVQMV